MISKLATVTINGNLNEVNVRDPMSHIVKSNRGVMTNRQSFNGNVKSKVINFIYRDSMEVST